MHTNVASENKIITANKAATIKRDRGSSHQLQIMQESNIGNTGKKSGNVQKGMS